MIRESIEALYLRIKSPLWVRILLMIVAYISIPIGIGVVSYFIWGPSKYEKTSSDIVEQVLTWKKCKGNILATWAAQDPLKVRERLSLVDEYIVWGAELPKGIDQSEAERLKDSLHEYRKIVVIDVSESELLSLDQKIFLECGQSPLFREHEDSHNGLWSWVAVIAGLAWMWFWLSFARKWVQ